jgi:hypothetical protein
VTLEDKPVLVLDGTSGIGFVVAEAAITEGQGRTRKNGMLNERFVRAGLQYCQVAKSGGCNLTDR